MAIVEGLITLAEARASLGWAATQTSDDADLERYVEAATPIIENITGPVLVASRVEALDGGRQSVLFPVRFTSVTSVTENGRAVTDYVADAKAGIITKGKIDAPDVFEPGMQNIVVTVSVGYADDASEVKANVKLAARELVRFMWQQGRQANIPAFGEGPESGSVPMGFLVPKRVQELLEPSRRLPGFA